MLTESEASAAYCRNLNDDELQKFDEKEMSHKMHKNYMVADCGGIFVRFWNSYAINSAISELLMLFLSCETLLNVTVFF